MLFVHQRILRGAKVLDFAGYGIDPNNCLYIIFIPVAIVVDKVLNNVNYKASDEEWLTETSK
jgi:hypothetical protein